MLVLRDGPLGLYAANQAELLRHSDHLKSAAACAAASRVALESKTLARLAAAQRQQSEAAAAAVKSEMPYSQLVVCARRPQDELVALPLYALAALPDLLKEVRGEALRWSRSHKLAGRVVLGARTYADLTLWELAGLLDGSLQDGDERLAVLFGAVLVPDDHAASLGALAALLGHKARYLALLLPADPAQALVPARLAYSWATAANAVDAATRELGMRAASQQASRVFSCEPEPSAVKNP